MLIRFYLAQFLGAACSSDVSWTPCVVSTGKRPGGALFKDLAANILGSFLMGLFVSSDVLAAHLKHTLTRQAPMAMLPRSSPLQGHTPLLVGLRTGLCGSITTFASWMLQIVMMMVGRQPMQPLTSSQWVEALGGIVVGTFCAMASLVVGQHAALALYDLFNPGAFIAYGTSKPSILLQEEDVVPAAAEAAHGSSSGLAWSGRSGPNGGAPGPEASGSAGGSGAARGGGFARELALDADRPGGGGGGPGAGAPTSQAAAPSNGRRSAPLEPLPRAPTRTVSVVEEVAPPPPPPFAVLAADATALLALSALTSVSAYLIAIYPARGGPFTPRSIWLAVLFAPIGCLLRFYLSRLNGALPGGLAWFPAGTFAANIGACVLDFVLEAVAARCAPGALAADVMSGVVAGVSGCLSTVSTWVVEIQKLMLPFPNHSRGYTYYAVSVGTAVTLGLAAYGGPVWAAE